MAVHRHSLTSCVDKKIPYKKTKVSLRPRARGKTDFENRGTVT